MKSVLMLVALAGPTSSSASERSPNEALMDEIERQVRLPADAEPLNHYGRYYAFDGKRRVKARYLLPPQPVTPDPLPADWGCEVMVMPGNELSTREIPCPPDPDISHICGPGNVAGCRTATRSR